MRQPKSKPIIVESGTVKPFPAAVEGRAARVNASAANDNRRPFGKTLKLGAGQLWRILPPVVGAGVVIYAMTH